MTNTRYKPIDEAFQDLLLEKARLRQYVKIQYFSEIREFLTVMSVIKEVYTQDEEAFMELITGEVMRLDRIVSIDGMNFPHFQDIMDFTCDC